MDSAIQEEIKTKVELAEKEIKTKMDSAIQEETKTKMDSAIQEETKTKMDSAIQEQIKTTVEQAQKVIKTKMDSAIKEKLKEIEIKMDSAIEGQIKTKVELAQKEMETKMDSAIQEKLKEIEIKMDSAIQVQIKTTVEQAQKEIETRMDSAIQEQIKTKVELAEKVIKTKMDSAIKEKLKEIEIKMDSAIEGQIKTKVELAQKEMETKMDSAIQEKLKEIEIKMDSTIQVQIKTKVQTVTTSIVIIFLGAALAVYWNLGNNRNENMTILPNGTIVVPDKEFKENVTLSLQLLKDELLQYQNKVQELQTAVTKVTDRLLYLQRDVKVLEGHEEIRTSKTIFSDTVFILLFGLAVEGLIFILLIKYLLGNRTVAHTDTVGNSEISQSRPSKLLEQAKQVQLDRSVCIVSFYEETQDLHLRLARSAIQTDIPIKQFLMKSPETQLLSIPKSRFILVFIDYNDRNIILETPGQDLGDKKVVTVQAAQKMGADVFVVYVRDKGSTNLPHGVLYNEHLTSFTRNLTLGNLTVRNRGLSVFETFTDHQKCHINGIIY